MAKYGAVEDTDPPGEDNSIAVDEAISLLGIGKAQYLLLLLTAAGYFAVCTEMLVFVFLQDTAAKEWNTSDKTFSLLPFWTSLGSVTGGVVFAFFSDRKGRRSSYTVSLGISSFFALASAFANSFWLFILLRSLGSFGSGGMFSVTFVYLMEFLPTEGRGRFMIATTAAGSCGATYTAGLAWILIPRQSAFLFLVLCSLPLIMVFIIRFFVNVESPRFLVSVGDYEGAMKALRWVSVQNKRKGALDGLRIAQTNPALRSKTEKTYSYLAIFSKEFIVHTLQLSFIWLSQSYGYWGVTSFFPKYLSQYGVPSYFVMFTNVCATFPGYVMAILLIDRPRIGRLHTMRFFSFGSALSLFLAVFLRDQISISVLSVTAYFFMVPMYAILEMYVPECYPTLMRSTAMSLLNLISAIPGMTAAFIGAEILAINKHWLYPLVWGSVFLLQFLLTITLKKETVQRSLEKKITETDRLCRDSTVNYGTN